MAIATILHGPSVQILGTFASEVQAAMCYDRHIIQQQGIQAVTNYDLGCYREELGEVLYHQAVAQGLVGTRPVVPQHGGGVGVGAGDASVVDGVACTGVACTGAACTGVAGQYSAVEEGQHAAPSNHVDVDQAVNATGHSVLTVTTTSMAGFESTHQQTTGVMGSHDGEASPSMHSMQAATGAVVWQGLVAGTPTSVAKTRAAV